MAKTIDIIGDIAIIKFSEKTWWIYKKLLAYIFLRKNKNITTVLEKEGDIKGRLRKFKTNYLAGIDKRETICRENHAQFYLHIDQTYFSPRLSNERNRVAQEISQEVKSGSKILVMFAGIAPFPIVLAKTLKNKNISVDIISSEINKKASEYAIKNVKLNKLENYVRVLQGDSKKIKLDKKFDIILMPRPNLKDTFIDSALKYSKNGTLIYYHGFGTEEKVKKEVSDKRMNVIYMRKAGDIAPRKWRWLVKLKVLKGGLL
jgi:tRNA (guanine37-N1)-methyltransferase